MQPLKGFQNKYLRGRANTLKPLVFIGKNGLNDDVFTAINEALESHELIKIKFLDFKKERKELSKKIEEQSKAHLAGLIGHVAIFYKQQKDKEKRKIKLPQRSKQ
jgi:RNA-binding protein